MAPIENNCKICGQDEYKHQAAHSFVSRLASTPLEQSESCNHDWQISTFPPNLPPSNKFCPKCSAWESLPSTKDISECDYCEGLGFRTESIEQDDDSGAIERVECPKCKGTAISESKSCEACEKGYSNINWKPSGIVKLCEKHLSAISERQRMSGQPEVSDWEESFRKQFVEFVGIDRLKADAMPYEIIDFLNVELDKTYDNGKNDGIKATLEAQRGELDKARKEGAREVIKSLPDKWAKTTGTIILDNGKKVIEGTEVDITGLKAQLKERFLQ